MADVNAKEAVVPASGSHLSLPGYFVPSDTGLIIPKTKVSAASASRFEWGTFHSIELCRCESVSCHATLLRGAPDWLACTH